METVYIIGNGFDLHHNLPTSYNDFHRHIIANCNTLENILEQYFSLRSGENLLWTNFEEDLGTFDWELFFDDNNHIDINDEDFRPSFTYGLEDDLIEQTEQLKTNIRKAFQDWLDTIDISSTVKKLKFLKDSTFINFNYTLILEEIYKIDRDKILHIHGDIINNPGELIFGHNATMKETSELDENGDSNRTIFADSENAAKSLFYSFYKPVEEIIATNANTFELLTNVKNIFVLGHSLNPIDMPYLKQISSRSKFAQWNVTYYNASEKRKNLSTLIQMGISPKDIRSLRL